MRQSERWLLQNPADLVIADSHSVWTSSSGFYLHIIALVGITEWITEGIFSFFFFYVFVDIKQSTNNSRIYLGFFGVCALVLASNHWKIEWTANQSGAVLVAVNKMLVTCQSSHWNWHLSSKRSTFTSTCLVFITRQTFFLESLNGPMKRGPMDHSNQRQQKPCFWWGAPLSGPPWHCSVRAATIPQWIIIVCVILFGLWAADGRGKADSGGNVRKRCPCGKQRCIMKREMSRGKESVKNHPFPPCPSPHAHTFTSLSHDSFQQAVREGQTEKKKNKTDFSMRSKNESHFLSVRHLDLQQLYPGGCAFSTEFGSLLGDLISEWLAPDVCRMSFLTLFPCISWPLNVFY